MKRVLMIPLAAALAVLTGCQEQAMLVDVNPDGSGTVTVRMYTNMPAGGGLFGGPGGGDAPAPDMAEQSKKAVEAIAKNLGGVEFQDGKAVTNAKGWKGYEALYTFADINKLVMTSEHTIEEDDGEGGSSSMTSGSDGPAYTFKFTPGSPATLEMMPQQEEDAEDGTAVDLGGGGEDAAQQAQMMQMMAPMLAGMRMSGMVRVNGQITDTNAEFRLGKNKNIVLLYDVQMDKMLKNPKLMKLMQEGGNKPPDMTINEDGMKMQNPTKPVKISFQ